MAKGTDGPGAPETQFDRVASQLRFMRIKERDLMNVTERMIDQHRRQIAARNSTDQRIFVLFERAKQIHRATTEDELSDAIAEIEKI
jgi:hypothetical protein